MSTSKHIDLICVVISVLTLLLTVLFINGEALGLATVAEAGAGDGQFTANDLDGDWDTAGATRITLTGDGGSVRGNGAYVYDGDVHILYAGKYVISGELNNGSVIIDADSNDKIWILLDGVFLHCDDSAAILVEQAGKVFLTLADGTENFVSSGGSYCEDAVSSKIDGTIYSRDDLTINGSGSLTVTAAYKHGIVCNDDIVIVGAHIEITAPQDGIHANDSGRFADMDLTISAGDDGITVKNDDETSYIYIESGNLNITSCYEGIEAIDITIAGGKIDIRPTDDGVNACGQGRNSVIRITGGDITIINETGRDADGMDSNGDILISGGNIFISVNTSSCALDYGSENGGVCMISGGTVIAAGGSAMAEGFDSSSEQCFIMYNTSAASAGTTVSLKNAAGTVLVLEAIPCGFSSVVISTPELRMGETCTLSIGTAEYEITVDNSSVSGGFGMGGMFGGGMPGGMQGGGMPGGMPGGMQGGRGGRTVQFAGEGQNAVSLVTTGYRDIPDAPGENFANGEMPQMPGDRPDWNGGNDPQGSPAQGEGRDPQNGEWFNGQEGFPGGMQTPDQDRGQNGPGGDLFSQWGQNQEWTQNDPSSDTSAISSDALLLVGVSVLILLAGLLIALKTKR